MIPQVENDRLTARPLGATAGQGQWLTAVSVLVVATAVLLFQFRDALVAMVEVWHNSSSFNHGYAIVPISAYLIWERRAALAKLSPAPSYWGLAVIGAFACAWLVGRFAGILMVQQFAIVGMIQGLFLTVLGWRVAWAMAFPLFYLFFAVPFGYFLVPQLQDITAVIVVWALRLTGMPVFSDGVMISIPSGNFEVAEACSGLRFLIASTALGFLCANLLYRSWIRRAAFLVLALAIPILANGMRAYGIIMLAHYTDSEFATGVDHIIYGWIFFAFVTVILLAIGMTFRDRGPAQDSADEGSPEAPPVRSSVGPRAVVLAGVASVLVVAGAPGFAAYTESRLATSPIPAVPVPSVGGTWIPKSVSTVTWRPEFPGADADVLYHFVSGRAQVDHYIAFYSYQREGAEVVQAQNRFSDDVRWRRTGWGKAQATVDGGPLNVRSVRMVTSGGGRVAWYWYWVDGEFTADPRMAKLLQLRATLLNGIPAAAVVAVSAEYRESPDEAVAALREYLEDLAPIGPVLKRAATTPSPDAGRHG